MKMNIRKPIIRARMDVWHSRKTTTSLIRGMGREVMTEYSGLLEDVFRLMNDKNAYIRTNGWMNNEAKFLSLFLISGVYNMLAFYNRILFMIGFILNIRQFRKEMSMR